MKPKIDVGIVAVLLMLGIGAYYAVHYAGAFARQWKSNAPQREQAAMIDEARKVAYRLNQSRFLEEIARGEVADGMSLAEVILALREQPVKKITDPRFEGTEYELVCATVEFPSWTVKFGQHGTANGAYPK